MSGSREDWTPTAVIMMVAEATRAGSRPRYQEPGW
jgi:hypothetical protein